MIDIRAATLLWAGDSVRVVAGDPEMGPGEYGQPIDGLQSAMAAGWLVVTEDGYAVATVHAALLGLDKYAEAYRDE